MPVNGPIAEPILTVVAAATLFTIMFTLGLGIVSGEFRWVFGRPALVAKGIFSVLIAVPALALVVTRAFDLPRAADIGIVLMAISPGAPVALRRALAAGGHRSFATALQILVALLAVVSMPLSIAALDEIYAGSASIAPGHLAQQVFTAQLLPLGLGILIRRFLSHIAASFEPKLARLASVLLTVFIILALIDVWQVVIGAGMRIALAIAVVTALALAVGHLLGGPDADTRTAVAISSAARNTGLALLGVTLNAAPPAIEATVLAYFFVSALTIVPYAMWRKRIKAAQA